MDCEWSDWTNSPCSKSCGGGQIIKKRRKIKEEIDTTCNGEPMTIEDCNTAKCEDKYNHFILRKSKLLLSCRISLYFGQIVITTLKINDFLIFYIQLYNVCGVLGLAAHVPVRVVVEFYQKQE